MKVELSTGFSIFDLPIANAEILNKIQHLNGNFIWHALWYSNISVLL